MDTLFDGQQDFAQDVCRPPLAAVRAIQYIAGILPVVFADAAAACVEMRVAMGGVLAGGNAFDAAELRHVAEYVGAGLLEPCQRPRFAGAHGATVAPAVEALVIDRWTGGAPHIRMRLPERVMRCEAARLVEVQI